MIILIGKACHTLVPTAARLSQEKFQAIIPVISHREEIRYLFIRNPGCREIQALICDEPIGKLSCREIHTVVRSISPETPIISIGETTVWEALAKEDPYLHPITRASEPPGSHIPAILATLAQLGITP